MMKKIIALLTGIILINSCSPINDEISTVVVPVSPTNLLGINSASAEVTLTWKDISTNETGFKIERKTENEIFTIIGTTKTDVTTYIDSKATNGLAYNYRVYSYNSAGNSPIYSNEITITSYGLPVLNTLPITVSPVTSSISTGGNITNDSGLTVNGRGIVWSTSANPTISLSTKTIDGNGIGIYSSSITTLLPDTTYYIRAYATNSKGTSYGTEIIYKTLPIFTIGSGVTDICGNSYPTIILKGKEWMQKNLDVCKYRNGDIIPEVQDVIKWANLTTGAWCYNEYKTANGIEYGKLYNWYAVNDSRGIAPVGWQIPSESDWEYVITYLGGKTVAGGKMKETGTIHWVSPNTGATNESGFTALAGGDLKPGSSFHTIGYNAVWWCSSIFPSYYQISGASISSSIGTSSGSSNGGYYIRCVKN